MVCVCVFLLGEGEKDEEEENEGIRRILGFYTWGGGGPAKGGVFPGFTRQFAYRPVSTIYFPIYFQIYICY